MLQGVITAIITPMLEDGNIDFDSFTDLIEHQIKNGVVGLVVLGSTGESTSISKDEKLAIINHAININNGRIKIIVGVAQQSTHEAISWINELNTITNIDLYMVLTPSYIKPTQHGLYQHFKDVAHFSKKPILLYNVPSRTGCNLSDDTILKLANEVPHIVGIKDATGDIARCCYLVKHKPSNFAIYSGDDETALAFILCGGNGVISVTSNIAPYMMSHMAKSAILGDKTEAIQYNNKIIDLHQLLFVESNPIPIKWALYNTGMIKSPKLRSPLTVLSNIYHEKITNVCIHIK